MEKPRNGKTEVVTIAKPSSGTKQFYIEEVNAAVKGCRELIKSIEGHDQLWKTKVSRKKKKLRRKLRRLNRKMSYKQYLQYLNDLKEITGRLRPKVLNIIERWEDESEKGMKNLGVRVTNELAPFKQQCAGSVQTIKVHIEKRKELLWKRPCLKHMKKK